ncbi:MAG TPA: hypothetical protein DGT21_10850 [Armatimonadetes bacterium]|jgi:predicted dehydrogenase|nr:hypothetical protein [Armatimonadota bacterium]
MAPLRWGIVGCGDIAHKSVAPILAADRNSELVAFFSHSMQRAEYMRETFGATQACDSLEALLGNERIEAVYIASPVHRHCPETLAALAAGKHVICEKPMALSAAECARMVDAAVEHDVHLRVAYYRRFWPKSRMMKRLISEGAIGRPLSARIRLASRFDPERDDPKYWRVGLATGGGGALQDVGSHRIDIMCFLLGRPRRVVGAAATLSMSYEAPDTETLICEFDSGVQMVCETCWNIPQAVDEFEVRGTDGTLLATPFDGPSLVLDRYTEREVFDTPSPPTLRHQGMLEDFSEAVSEGRAPGFSALDGLLTTAIIDAAYRSNASGRWEETASGALRT